MSQLFPIIRRARRPLLVMDSPPAVAGNVEPVKVNATDVSPANVAGEKPQLVQEQIINAPAETNY